MYYIPKVGMIILTAKLENYHERRSFEETLVCETIEDFITVDYIEI